MTLPSADRLRAAMVATWPASESLDMGPYRLCRSDGGGQRVTAARVAPGASGLAEALPDAVAQMRAWGQAPIFMVTPETPGLDALLEHEGYVIHDPVTLYAAPLARIAEVPTPRLSTFAHWPPLAIQEDIWAEGGIGPDRVAVMARVAGVHASVLARQDDMPVGTGFAAVSDAIVMVHAIEVRPNFRRQGVGARILSRAAQWAATQGATHLGLAVTEANIGARALYAGLGMTPAARYHYRVLP